MNVAELTEIARGFGFAKVIVADLAYRTYPVCVFLLMPYAPGKLLSNAAEPVISSYYPASNAAYHGAKRIAELLRAEGFQAESGIEIPLKPALVRFGIGEMGKNSLIAVKGFGSRFHVQTIATDAPFETIHERVTEKRTDEACLGCDRCVRACPTGAILPDMRIDTTKCLRAVSEMTPPPAEMRAKLGNRLLGCDVCQNVCPRNPVSDGDAACQYSLKRLLEGDLDELKGQIGANYVRKRRMRVKAAILSANLRRTDLLPLLKEMEASGDEAERESAIWAIRKLEGLQ